MKIVVSQANSREELLGAFEFVRFVDKHADMVHKAMVESVEDMTAQAVSIGREDRAHVGDIKRKYEALITKIKESDLEQGDKSYWIDRANTDILGGFLGHRPANPTARNPGPDASNVIGLSKSIDDAIQQQAIDAERQSWDDAMKDEEDEPTQQERWVDEEDEDKVREAIQKAISVVNEKQDPHYSQYTYELIIDCIVDKVKGGNLAQTLSDIRGIPYVTTVASEPVPGKETPQQWATMLKIKFVRADRLGPYKFMASSLVPKLKTVRGLSNIKIRTVKKVEEYS